MRLKNKKTGEIIDVYRGQVLLHYNGGKETIHFKSLEELEEWEDYEEPKEFWFIDDEGDVEAEGEEYEDQLDKMKLIGNYFETKEEAEKAVEKLKAWKRLSEDNFAFVDWYWEDKNVNENGSRYFSITGVCDPSKISEADLDLLFSGEDD